MQTITNGVVPVCVAIGLAQVSVADTLGETVGSENERSGTASLEAQSALSAGSKQPRQSRRGQPIEEVIVTAQKREERLQDVPISISVLGGEQLDAYAGGAARDALRTVPGVAFSQGLFGDGTTLSIRGVGPSGELALPFASSTVGYYMDGVPFGFSRFPFVPDTNVYDLDRIEVLRGPQGTLYGASSLNGVVRVLTHEADLNALQLKSRAMASTMKGGDETYRVDGAINVPIVEGKLAARATVSYADVGGWIDNLTRKDINSAQNLDTRLKVKAQPTDALSISLSYWRSRHDVDAQSLSDSNYFYPGRLHPTGDIDFDAYGGEISYDFQGVTVSSTTSYIDYSNETSLDWSAFENLFGLTGYFHTLMDAKVFSEELLARSSNDGDWRWSVGAFYRDVKDGFLQGCPTGCFVGSTVTFPLSGSTTKSESYAAFGEVTKLFLDGALELTGGLRYFRDHVEDGLTNDSSFNPSSSFEKVTPRVVLAWHANEDNTLYASYSKGFRSGLNQNREALLALPDLVPVKPDSLDNYEIGVKGNLRDNRLAYEAAVYYVDWKDTQQSLLILLINPDTNAPFTTVGGLNAESASGLGAEFSLMLRPATGLTLTGSFGVNDIAVDAPIYSGSFLFYDKGSRLNGSAKYTAASSASYIFPLGESGLDSTLSLSGSYASPIPQVFLNSITGVVTNATGDPFFSMQGSVTISAADRWSLQLFGDNLTNERRYLQADALSNFGFDSYSRIMRPRTIGLQFEFSY